MSLIILYIPVNLPIVKARHTASSNLQQKFLFPQADNIYKGHRNSQVSNRAILSMPASRIVPDKLLFEPYLCLSRDMCHRYAFELE